MRDYLLIYLFFLLTSISLIGQVQNGCISIDFESLPTNEIMYEGLALGNQFENSFGLTFELEGGGIPVIAEVGGAFAAAFGSNWGNDTPAPGVDMGRFFLTDDGELSGTVAPPIILRFKNPIDTFTGCIVDMDFSEEFILQALDSMDNVLLADTITAGNVNTGEVGDPGTGDGLLTCWGINIPGCEAQISTIIFSGTRPSAGGGAFGLGLDNLSFCFTELEFEEIRDDVTCSSLGSISITVNQPGEYEFSFDEVNYTSQSFYDGLEAGDYKIFVRDQDGCIYTIPFFILDYEPSVLTIDNLDTQCNENNGTIVLNIDPDYGAQFSIDDGATYNPSNTFTDLAPGEYLIRVQDSLDCFYFGEATIDPSTEPQIDALFSEDEICENVNGIIFIEASGGTGILNYSLDGITYQDSDQIENLASGSYTIYVKDEMDCIVEGVVDIGDAPVDLKIDALSSEEETCNNGNGSISIAASGGNGSLSYSLDGSTYGPETTIENLTAGMYTVYVRDDLGCLISEVIEVLAGAVPLILGVDVTLPDCFQNNGVVAVNVSGGTGNLYVSLDSINFQSDMTFENLSIGDYTLQLRDDTGCTVSEFVAIESPLCPIYIPNVITPHGDDREQFFKAFTHEDYGVGIIEYRIYDRWGELVFVSGQFSIHTQDTQYWWDGYFNGKPVEQGVYAYLIEVRHPNDTVESYAGDVTVLW